MVGAYEEMSVTVVRWKVGEAQLKKDLDEEELKKVVEEKEKKDTQGACAVEPEGEPEREPEKKPEKKPEGEPEGKPGVKKPDFTFLMIERVIDTILLEEVAHLSMKMNRYRGILAEGIRAYAEDHQEDKADLSRFVEALRQGWKVYRVNEHKKASLDTFMEVMNNVLWVSEIRERVMP